MTSTSIDFNGYTITDDKSRIQVSSVHQWLSEESYWSKNITRETVMTSVANSYCVSVLRAGEQIGFARMITDFATFAYMADVYVIESHRGKGLAQQMIRFMLDRPWVSNLRRIMLASLDAQGLYARFGFGPILLPERLMEKKLVTEYKTPE